MKLYERLGESPRRTEARTVSAFPDGNQVESLMKNRVVPDLSNNKKEKIMKIEILGTGCAKCKKLYENTLEALKLSGKEAEVSKVEDIKDIVAYGVMSTPAIVVDGVVKVSGKLVSPEEIKAML